MRGREVDCGDEHPAASGTQSQGYRRLLHHPCVLREEEGQAGSEACREARPTAPPGMTASGAGRVTTMPISSLSSLPHIPPPLSPPLPLSLSPAASAWTSARRRAPRCRASPPWLPTSATPRCCWRPPGWRGGRGRAPNPRCPRAPPARPRPKAGGGTAGRQGEGRGRGRRREARARARRQRRSVSRLTDEDTACRYLRFPSVLKKQVLRGHRFASRNILPPTFAPPTLKPSSHHVPPFTSFQPAPLHSPCPFHTLLPPCARHSAGRIQDITPYCSDTRPVTTHLSSACLSSSPAPPAHPHIHPLIRQLPVFPFLPS